MNQQELFTPGRARNRIAELDRRRAGVPTTVLILDVDDELRRQHRRCLRAAGYQVAVAASADIGLRIARACAIDVVVVDAALPDVDGWGVVAQLRADAHLCEARVVLMGSSPQGLAELEAAGVSVDASFAKGSAARGLVDVVDGVLAPRFAVLRALRGGENEAGTLAEVGVQNLLRGICETRRRGRLEVHADRSSAWFVDFDDGVIARAVFCAVPRAQTSASGEEQDAARTAVFDRAALLELLAWGDAPWFFCPLAAAPPRTLGLAWGAWGTLSHDLCDQLNQQRADLRAELLAQSGPLFVDAARLALWLGRVDPGAAAVAEALVRGVPPRDLIAARHCPLEVDQIVQDLVRRSVVLLEAEPA